MSLCVLNSRAREGIGAPAVIVEVHVAGGLPTLPIVGLPEAAVRESKDRGHGALLNSHFRFSAGRVTINLAPADLPRKAGVSICPSPWGSWGRPINSGPIPWAGWSLSGNSPSRGACARWRVCCRWPWRRGRRAGR